MCGVKKLFTVTVLVLQVLLTCAADVSVDIESDGTCWYAGAAGGVMIPGGGGSLRRAAEVSVRCGRYLSDFFAFELEGLCAPWAVLDSGGGATISGVALQGVLHCAGWEAFDRLFGYERFDPFVMLGGAARFTGHHVFADDSRRTAQGPVFGLGAFYHLSDYLSLRIETRAQLCCDSPCGMLYGVYAGLQYSFGEGW